MNWCLIHSWTLASPIVTQKEIKKTKLNNFGLCHHFMMKELYIYNYQHKQILVHPGAVTDEIGIARSAFNGGPLGELVQWSDLVSTLHILGHHLHLSASITDLKM